MPPTRIVSAADKGEKKTPLDGGGRRAGLSLGDAACGSRARIMAGGPQGQNDGTARYPRNPQDRLHRKLEGDRGGWPG
jgi:hypothetical protein